MELAVAIGYNLIILGAVWYFVVRIAQKRGQKGLKVHLSGLAAGLVFSYQGFAEIFEGKLPSREAPTQVEQTVTVDESSQKQE